MANPDLLPTGPRHILLANREGRQWIYHDLESKRWGEVDFSDGLAIRRCGSVPGTFAIVRPDGTILDAGGRAHANQRLVKGKLQALLIWCKPGGQELWFLPDGRVTDERGRDLVVADVSCGRTRLRVWQVGAEVVRLETPHGVYRRGTDRSRRHRWVLCTRDGHRVLELPAVVIPG